MGSDAFCAMCKNRTGVEMVIDGKSVNLCGCGKGKYDSGRGKGYFNEKLIRKPSKELQTIQDCCDSWEDWMKGKSN